MSSVPMQIFEPGRFAWNRSDMPSSGWIWNARTFGGMWWRPTEPKSEWGISLNVTMISVSFLASRLPVRR